MKSFIIFLGILFLCCLAGAIGGITVGLARSNANKCQQSSTPVNENTMQPEITMQQKACLSSERKIELATAYVLMTIGEDNGWANEVVNAAPDCATPQNLLHTTCTVTKGGQVGDKDFCRFLITNKM